MGNKILHLVSDSTGETVSAAATAVLSQFEGHMIEKRMHVFVRSAADIGIVMEDVRAYPGPVIYTLLNRELSKQLESECNAVGVSSVPFLKPFFDVMTHTLGAPQKDRPGRQYEIDGAYFERVSAIDYAMTHDDGRSERDDVERLQQADVILLGVSRTSKTPTCLYLAVRGIKAANVPLVTGRPLPSGLEQAIAAGVPAVGLVASPNRLVQIRGQRLDTIGGQQAERYAEPEFVREEVAQSRMLFERLDLPVIDVTRRSIEETAAEIMALLRARSK